MGKKVKFSWTSALIGAVAAIATTTAIAAKPKRPKFRLVSLTALQLKFNGGLAKPNEGRNTQNELKLPQLDANLILTVHVTNPNILPIRYTATSLSIYYDGSLLGSAQVSAGCQPAKSCQLLRLPARLSGLELAQHAQRFVADVAKRKMVLNAEVDICGRAKGILWDPRFKVHVDSHVVVDPILLDVVDQENVSRLELFV